MLDERAAGIHRDFFLSGGDSLKAVELFAAIHTRFGVELDVRHIFDAGATVAGLADLIARARAGQPGPTLPEGLIPLKSNGARPPLFAVPPSGEPACFMDLARLLDPEQPLYGLRSRGLDGQCRPLDRVEEIAADYVGTIRALRHRGAYFLMGVGAAAGLQPLWLDLRTAMRDVLEQTTLADLVARSSSSAISPSPTDRPAAR